MTRDPLFVRRRLSALQYWAVFAVFWSILLAPFVVMWGFSR